jgi:type I restriction enzyme, S subunit
MIADLKPYTEYKESGLPWLGKVPRHWDVHQVRHVGRLFKGVGGTKEDAVPVGVPCVRYGELYTTHTYFICASKSFITPHRAADYTPIEYGDVLFAASGETIEEIGKSAVNLMHTAAICGGDVIILRPTIPVHAPFLGYAMDCRPATNQKATMGRGTTVKHIYPDELRSLLFPLPTLEEQAAIVRFLDWTNGRLERAIRAKRKVIALLTEQKQAIIHRAVTRGLDPSVPLKPSGIPWLGDIPQHWEVRRLKFVANRIVDCLHATPRYSDSGSYPAIRTADISPGIVHVSKAKRVSSADYARWTERLEPAEGDILYSREGERFGIAACVPAGVQLCISQRMMAFRVAKEHCADFVMKLLNSQSTYGQALQDVMGATAPHVNISTIRNFFLAMPARQEQEAIVEQVLSEVRPIEDAISRLEREIELLREYRTRLVADVVTGKLDVREAAARLPEEAGEVGLSDLSDESDLLDVSDGAGEPLPEDEP